MRPLLDRDAVEDMFFDGGEPCPHVYLSCWVEAAPETKTVALWRGGPRAEVYNAVQERDVSAHPMAGFSWRLLVYLDLPKWQRWKRRQVRKR
jgi:hypothetical protein